MNQRFRFALLPAVHLAIIAALVSWSGAATVADAAEKDGRYLYVVCPGIRNYLEYGGAGMDTIAYVLAMIEIAKADAAHSAIMSVQNSLVNPSVRGHHRVLRKISPANLLSDGLQVIIVLSQRFNRIQ